MKYKEEITCNHCGKLLGYKPEDTIGLIDKDITWIDKRNANICYYNDFAFCSNDECIRNAHDYHDCEECGEDFCIHTKYVPEESEYLCNLDLQEQQYIPSINPLDLRDD